MPRGDVVRLLAFYRSPAGRARRKAVLDGFRAQADADARTIVLAALRQLKDGPASGEAEGGAPR